MAPAGSVQVIEYLPLRRFPLPPGCGSVRELCFGAKLDRAQTSVSIVVIAIGLLIIDCRHASKRWRSDDTCSSSLCRNGRPGGGVLGEVRESL